MTCLDAATRRFTVTWRRLLRGFEAVMEHARAFLTLDAGAPDGIHNHAPNGELDLRGRNLQVLASIVECELEDGASFGDCFNDLVSGYRWRHSTIAVAVNGRTSTEHHAQRSHAVSTWVDL